MMVDENAKQRALQIWQIGQSEPEYYEMLMEIREQERAFEDVLKLLPETQEETIRDFVSQYEAMSWRMLQIACALMRFPDSEDE